PLTSLWGQNPLQRLAHGLFDCREKGLIALLNGLPDAPKLRCRPENPARLPSVSGIPDPLNDEHTHRVVHTLSSQELVRNPGQARLFGESWLHQSAGVVRSMCGRAANACGLMIASIVPLCMAHDGSRLVSTVDHAGYWDTRLSPMTPALLCTHRGTRQKAIM